MISSEKTLKIHLVRYSKKTTEITSYFADTEKVMNHTEKEKSAVDPHLDGLVDYDRTKPKLTQPNSQFDEELLLDGITLAGAYFESGIRDFMTMPY